MLLNIGDEPALVKDIKHHPGYLTKCKPVTIGDIRNRPGGQVYFKLISIIDFNRIAPRFTGIFAF